MRVRRSLITEATGLGKGSLYNLFPGGKEQMANEVLAAIDLWFNEKIYTPLRTAADPAKESRTCTRRPAITFTQGSGSVSWAWWRSARRAICSARK
jgi:AcrR family transcriptional regulator